MEVYKTFITKSDQLEKTFQRLQRQTIPDTFDQQFLNSVGLREPNTIFYINLFKMLGLVDENGDPNLLHYSKFAESENEARLFISERLPELYSKIYAEDPYAYRLPEEELYDLFQRQMLGSKSETFVRLVANTYKTLALYADKGVKKEPQLEPALATPQNGTNGHHHTNGYHQRDNGYEEIDIEEAENPCEEFLIELLNGCSVHEYRTDTSSSEELDKNEKEAISEEESVNEMKVDEEPIVENEPDEHHRGEGFFPEEINHSDQTGEDQAFDSPDDFTGKGDFAGDNIDKARKTLLSKSLVKRAELLVKMSRKEEAVEAYHDIITYYVEKDYPIGIENVADAYYKKGCLCEEMGNFEKALETFTEFIATCKAKG